MTTALPPVPAVRQPSGERSRATARPLLLLLFALAVHLPARMDGLYGEQDTARLVNDALLWTRAGLRTESLSQYRYYTSPGYIWLVTRLLPEERGDAAPAAAALNAINLIASVLIVPPLYLLFRRIASGRAAFIATLLLSVMPAFWIGGLYGFPSMPAALFFVVALWLFDRWLLRDGDSPAAAATLAVSSASLTVAVLLKADLYLSAIALWGLLLYRRRLSWRNATVVTVLGLISLLVLYGVAAALLQRSPGAIAYAGQWNSRFPVEAGPAVTATHVMQVVKSMGLLSLPLFAVACTVFLGKRRYGLVALLVSWAAVSIAFWFFRWGDTARHHFPSTIPVALGIGILLAELRVHDIWRYAALACVVGVNYFAFAPSDSTITTSGNLRQSGEMVARRVANYHHLARLYADRDVPRKAYIGSYTNPYVENRTLWIADSVVNVRPLARFGFRATEVEYLYRGRRYLSVTVALPFPPKRTDAEAVAAAYDSAGYAVFSMQFFDPRGPRNSASDLRLSEY